jgi:glycosyltransferase involved in cell wall biosynthesis
MASGKIYVSIIIPIYNAENYLRRCINSILKQSFTSFECILINDYSSDNSLAICRKFAESDSRVKIINNSSNLGASRARKTGLEKASGEFILFIDADDWIEGEALDLLYGKAINGGYDIIYFNYYNDTNETSRYYRQDFTSSENTTILKKILSLDIRCYLWNKLVKKELYQLVTFPELQFSSNEDYVISFQLFFFARAVGFVENALYHYCFYPNSLSHKFTLRRKIEENKNWDLIISNFKNYFGPDLSVLEPELSNKINTLKFDYLKDPRTLFILPLYNLFPESRFFTYSLKRLFNKIPFKRKV